MEHTSLPEKILSLANSHLDLRYKNLSAQSLLDLLSRSCLKKELQGFLQVLASLFH
jgi:hypothetical protein